MPNATSLSLKILSLVGAMIFMSSVALAASQTYFVKIDGMVCADCAKMIESKLEKIPNVDPKTLQVVLKKKSATVTLTEDRASAADEIKKAVEDAGYTVAKIELVKAQH